MMPNGHELRATLCRRAAWRHISAPESKAADALALSHRALGVAKGAHMSAPAERRGPGGVVLGEGGVEGAEPLDPPASNGA
jgi:hypothetical protein